MGAICAVGVLATAAITAALWRGMEENAQLALDRDAGSIADAVSDAVEAGVDRLQGIRGFFEASERVSDIEFARFSTRVGASPGVVGMGQAVWVEGERLADFQSRASSDRSWFRLTFHRSAHRRPDDRHLIVWYANQFRIVPRPVGFDLTSDPVRATAISAMSRNGGPAVSSFIEVPGSGGATVEMYSAAATGDDDVVVFVTLDLQTVIDAHIARTGANVTAALDELPPVGIRTADLWEDGIAIGPNRVRLIVTSVAARDQRTWVPLATAAGGLAATLLGALIALHRRRAREREAEIQHLRRSAEEKDVFLASVSHELRTPLTSVVGLTGVVVDEWDRLSDAEIRECVVMAHNEATELTNLVEDLLTIGRVEGNVITYARETVDLRVEVTKVITRVATDKQITVGLAPGAVLVDADPLRVRQVVRNLVVNAVRYGATRVEVVSSRRGGVVALGLRNDGPPIDDEQVTHLFAPYQGRRRRNGQPESIGLGLHISRRLAEGMGGDLTYEYVDGWCEFWLSLPAASSGAQAFDEGSEVEIAPSPVG